MSHPVLQALRKSLRARFPAAHGDGTPSVRSLAKTSASTELPDFPEGGLTEVVSAPLTPGTGLLISALIGKTSAHDGFPRTALVDATDRFDPCSHGTEECAALLWLRCRNLREALRCTDLLARDGNLRRVILDLGGCPAEEVQRVPPSVWQRWKQPVATHMMQLIALTPAACIPCPALRLSLAPGFGLADFTQSRNELRGLLRFPVSRSKATAR